MDGIAAVGFKVLDGQGNLLGVSPQVPVMSSSGVFQWGEVPLEREACELGPISELEIGEAFHPKMLGSQARPLSRKIIHNNRLSVCIPENREDWSRFVDNPGVLTSSYVFPDYGANCGSSDTDNGFHETRIQEIGAFSCTNWDSDKEAQISGLRKREIRKDQEGVNPWEAPHLVEKEEEESGSDGGWGEIQGLEEHDSRSCSITSMCTPEGARQLEASGYKPFYLKPKPGFQARSRGVGGSTSNTEVPRYFLVPLVVFSNDSNVPILLPPLRFIVHNGWEPAWATPFVIGVNDWARYGLSPNEAHLAGEPTISFKPVCLFNPALTWDVKVPTVMYPGLKGRKFKYSLTEEAGRFDVDEVPGGARADLKCFQEKKIGLGEIGEAEHFGGDLILETLPVQGRTEEGVGAGTASEIVQPGTLAKFSFRAPLPSGTVFGLQVLDSSLAKQFRIVNPLRDGPAIFEVPKNPGSKIIVGVQALGKERAFKASIRAILTIFSKTKISQKSVIEAQYGAIMGEDLDEGLIRAGLSQEEGIKEGGSQAEDIGRDFIDPVRFLEELREGGIRAEGVKELLRANQKRRGTDPKLIEVLIEDYIGWVEKTFPNRVKLSGPASEVGESAAAKGRKPYEVSYTLEEIDAIDKEWYAKRNICSRNSEEWRIEVMKQMMSTPDLDCILDWCHDRLAKQGVEVDQESVTKKAMEAAEVIDRVAAAIATDTFEGWHGEGQSIPESDHFMDDTHIDPKRMPPGGNGGKVQKIADPLYHYVLELLIKREVWTGVSEVVEGAGHRQPRFTAELGVAGRKKDIGRLYAAHNKGGNKALILQSPFPQHQESCHRYLRIPRARFYTTVDMAKAFNVIRCLASLAQYLCCRSADCILWPLRMSLGFANVPASFVTAFGPFLTGMKFSQEFLRWFTAQMEEAIASDSGSGVGLPEDLCPGVELTTVRSRMRDRLKLGGDGWVPKIQDPREAAEEVFGAMRAKSERENKVTIEVTQQEAVKLETEEEGQTVKEVLAEGFGGDLMIIPEVEGGPEKVRREIIERKAMPRVKERSATDEGGSGIADHGSDVGDDGDKEWMEI